MPCSRVVHRSQIPSLQFGEHGKGLVLRFGENTHETDLWVLYTSLPMICWIRLGVLLLASGEVTTQWSQPKILGVLNTMGVLGE